jgi:hypothetical protein
MLELGQVTFGVLLGFAVWYSASGWGILFASVVLWWRRLCYNALFCPDDPGEWAALFRPFP